MPDSPLPPTGFFYEVRLGNARSGSDTRFKEVSGLTVELALDEVAEGGENRFKHRVPTTAKYTNLVLKRGLVVKGLPFYQWCKKTLQANFAKPIEPRGIQVVLLNESAQPLKTWSIINAWPVKWSISDFSSMDGQVVIETLEMAYQYFDVA